MTYAAARSEIKTGDMLAFSGHGPLHLGVRAWCRAITRKGPVRYSHTGLVVWLTIDGLEREIFCIEQELVGCRMSPLGKVVERFNGEIDWYSLVGDVDRIAMVEYAKGQLLEKYSWAELFNTFVRGSIGFGEASICSTMYRQALSRGGIVIEDKTLTPDELAKRECFTLRGTLQ